MFGHFPWALFGHFPGVSRHPGQMESSDVPKQKNLSRNIILLVLEAHNSDEALLCPSLCDSSECARHFYANFLAIICLVSWLFFWSQNVSFWSSLQSSTACTTTWSDDHAGRPAREAGSANIRNACEPQFWQFSTIKHFFRHVRRSEQSWPSRWECSAAFCDGQFSILRKVVLSTHCNGRYKVCSKYKAYKCAHRNQAE